MKSLSTLPERRTLFWGVTVRPAKSSKSISTIDFARGVLEDVFIVAAGNTLGDVPGEHDAGIVPAFLGFGYGIGLNAGSGALEASSLSGIRSLKACCYGGSSKGSGKDQCEQTLHSCSPIVCKIDSFYL